MIEFNKNIDKYDNISDNQYIISKLLQLLRVKYKTWLCDIQEFSSYNRNVTFSVMNSNMHLDFHYNYDSGTLKYKISGDREEELNEDINKMCLTTSYSVGDIVEDEFGNLFKVTKPFKPKPYGKSFGSFILGENKVEVVNLHTSETHSIYFRSINISIN